MGSLYRYFKIQLKRALKLFPLMFIFNLVLTVSLFTLAYMALRELNDSEKTAKIKVAIVGSEQNSYLGFGVSMMKNLDSSRFSVDFENLSEKEAKEKLRKGEIISYTLLDDEFIAALGRGENLPLTYVTLPGSVGLVDDVTREIADTVTSTIVDAEKSIYAMQEYITDSPALKGELQKATDELNIKLIKTVLKRNDMYEVTSLTVYNNISAVLYYTLGFLVFLIMLMGINASVLTVKKDDTLTKILYSRGAGALKQLCSEFCVYFLLVFSNIFIISAIIYAVFGVSGIEVTDASFFEFILIALPVVFMLSAVQYMICEFIGDLFTAVSLQLLLAISTAYISGCFYPISFFPELMQKLSRYIPLRIAFEYMQESLSVGRNMQKELILYLIACICLGLALFFRRRRQVR